MGAHMSKLQWINVLQTVMEGAESSQDLIDTCNQKLVEFVASVDVEALEKEYSEERSLLVPDFTPAFFGRMGVPVKVFDTEEEATGADGNDGCEVEAPYMEDDTDYPTNEPEVDDDEEEFDPRPVPRRKGIPRV